MSQYQGIESVLPGYYPSSKQTYDVKEESEYTNYIFKVRDKRILMQNSLENILIKNTIEDTLNNENQMSNVLTIFQVLDSNRRFLISKLES